MPASKPPKSRSQARLRPLAALAKAKIKPLSVPAVKRLAAAAIGWARRPNFNTLIPELTVSNLEKSLDFYVRVLGFKIEYEREKTKFAFLSFHGAQLMLDEDNGNWVTAPPQFPRGRGINFEIAVPKIAVLVARLGQDGVQLFREPREVWRQTGQVVSGNAEFLVLDPDGYLLRFSETLGYR